MGRKSRRKKERRLLKQKNSEISIKSKEHNSPPKKKKILLNPFLSISSAILLLIVSSLLVIYPKLISALSLFIAVISFLGTFSSKTPFGKFFRFGGVISEKNLEKTFFIIREGIKNFSLIIIIFLTYIAFALPNFFIVSLAMITSLLTMLMICLVFLIHKMIDDYFDLKAFKAWLKESSFLLTSSIIISILSIGIPVIISQSVKQSTIEEYFQSIKKDSILYDGMIDYSSDLSEYHDRYLLWFRVSSKIWEIKRLDMDFKRNIPLWGKPDWRSPTSTYKVSKESLAPFGKINIHDARVHFGLYTGSEKTIEKLKKIYGSNYNYLDERNILKRTLADYRMRTLFEFRELWDEFQRKFPPMHITIQKNNVEDGFKNRRLPDLRQTAINLIEPYINEVNKLAVTSRVFQIYIVNKIYSIKFEIFLVIASITGFIFIYILSKKITAYNKKYDSSSVSSDALFLIFITCLSLTIAIVTT